MGNLVKVAKDKITKVFSQILYLCFIFENHKKYGPLDQNKLDRMNTSILREGIGLDILTEVTIIKLRIIWLQFK